MKKERKKERKKEANKRMKKCSGRRKYKEGKKE